MMLGRKQPVGFSSEIKGRVGTASVGGWKKKGWPEEMWFFWDLKVAPKWNKLVETDVWEQCTLVLLVLYPSYKWEGSFGLQNYHSGSFHHKWFI